MELSELTRLSTRHTVLLSIEDVVERTSLSRRTIYNITNAGEFPQMLKLSERRVAFVEAEIEAWIEDKMRLRDLENRQYSQAL